MKKDLINSPDSPPPTTRQASGTAPSAPATLADSGSAHYRFERLEAQSEDAQRHYRLDLAIPRREAPASGYPVLYLLDGNNVLAELREEWLAQLVAGEPPLLVMIGYDTDERIDMEQRTRDYTGSTAVDFLELLESRIKPLVQAGAPIDRSRQMLWGHSFGGLFVLYALLAKPTAFQGWIAASPSLWYQPETFHQGLAAQAIPVGSTHRVLLMCGATEGRPPIAQFDGGSARRRQEMSAVPADAAQRLARRLARVPGVQASCRVFHGHNHGQMFVAALPPALRWAAGLPDDC